MIKLTGVVKTYDGQTNIVDGLSMEIAAGELLVILGSSGSGKTTTLKMINRLEDPTSGQITIDGKDISLADPVQLRRTIGYVFQGIGLFPHLTVEENISIVLRLNGVSETKCQQQAHRYLADVNLEPSSFADRYPSELSGGQQQRVGVARALVIEPQLLLMDEPFGALDAINRHSLQSEILRLKKSYSKTILFVTHDILEAIRLGDRIAIMNKGQLEQLGTKKEIVRTPATPFVQQLLEKTTKQFREYVDLLDE